MKSTLILWCLHGNPGSFEDFKNLKMELEPSGIELKALKFDFEDPARTLDPVNPSDMLLGYSWGSYGILKSIETSQKQISNRIFLVAPFLASSKPLTSFSKFLILTPLISSALIHFSFKKWSLDFQKRMFSQDEISLAPEFLESLNSPATWKQTLSNKIFQESNPLSPKVANLIKAPVNLLLGKRDQIINESEVLAQLHSLNLSHETGYLSLGGHALPWTHKKEIAQWLLAALQVKGTKK
jgi:hypothetical protein